MATGQWLMAGRTRLKIALLTENGNNCPTSEQASNRILKELCPVFRGSERVKENYNPPDCYTPPKRGRAGHVPRNPVGRNGVHTYMSLALDTQTGSS